MSGRELARWYQPGPPERRTRVDGELTASRDELVVQLRPTPASGWAAPGCERRTVMTRAIHPPVLVEPVVDRPSRGCVLDREGVTAWFVVVLVVVLLITVWVVVS